MVQILWSSGARNILLAKVPDLSLTPRFHGSDDARALSEQFAELAGDRRFRRGAGGPEPEPGRSRLSGPPVTDDCRSRGSGYNVTEGVPQRRRETPRLGRGGSSNLCGDVEKPLRRGDTSRSEKRSATRLIPSSSMVAGSGTANSIPCAKSSWACADGCRVSQNR